MSQRQNTGHAQSVRARLKALAKLRGERVAFVQHRYANERLLYRLSCSPHKTRFILKGATLFMLWTGTLHRATRDIDLLGSGDPSHDALADIFREICEMSIDDALDFDSTTVIAAEIGADKLYTGCRIKMTAFLGRSPLVVQVDIGFGDALSPGAVPIPEHQTLLDMPPCALNVYPRESVVAEKFHALVSLGERNTRLKDFYDLWFLLQHFCFDRNPIERALNATFSRRQTDLPMERPYGLSPRFWGNTSRQRQWRSFLKKQGQVFVGPRAERFDIGLESVIAVLERFFMPLIEVGSAAPGQRWPEGGPWS